MRINGIVVACVIALLCAGCAAAPEVAERRESILADIDEILSMPLDPAEFGDTERCLSESQYRSFKPLGDRHILFEGRRDKQWINSLRGRCPQLRHSDFLIMKPTLSRRMCDMDRFEPADWFDWPWYRRWPWQWGGWGSGGTCSLGKFHPVTEAQVAEIEALLEQW